MTGDYLDDLARPPTSAEVLRLAMSAYSEEMWCAGWHMGVEEEIWRVGGGWHDLARYVGGWWTYERFVPLDEWLAAHPEQTGGTPVSDPLADVIAAAAAEWWREALEHATKSEHQAAAVRAHLAAVLDAEEARCVEGYRTARLEGLRDRYAIEVKTIRRIRKTLVPAGGACSEGG